MTLSKKCSCSKMAMPPPPPPPPALLGDSISPSPSGTSLLSTASTGLSSESNSAEKPWKRPLTMEEIRQYATSWSLAGDSGLLLYFKQFSQNMLRKTHELEKVVDDLVHDSKGMGSKVHTAFNDFLMLSNKQFIENRVYDEEIVQEETAEKEATQQPAKSREQLESEIFPRYSQAVNLGFQVLDDAFITVELKPTEESDDEDEEALPSGYVPDPIIEPKDMYACRPLPHLIGSAEFFSDETLGLIEVDDEDEDEEQNKAVSKDEEESETSDSEEETESEISESSDEEVVKKTEQREVSDDSDSDELFGESKKQPSSSEESDSEEEQPKPKLGIQEELAAKLGLKEQPTVKGANEPIEDKLDTQSISSRSTADNQSIISAADTVSIASTVKSKKDKSKHRTKTNSITEHKKHKGSEHRTHSKHKDEESDDDLFKESKPENNLEDESPFGKKGGMFSGGGKLFDDEGGEDLFADANPTTEPTTTEAEQEAPETPTEIKPKTRTTSEGKKIPVGAVSLFGEGLSLFSGDSTPATQKAEKEAEPKVKQPTKTSLPPVKGLFDDDEDELFSDKPKKDQLKEPEKPKRKKTLELFNDDEDVLFSGDDSTPKSQTTTTQQPNLPDSKQTTVNKESSNALTASKEKVENSAKKSESKSKVVSLFDDDGAEEEDWFNDLNPEKTKSIEKPQPNVTKSAPSQNSSLFSDPEDSFVDTKNTKEVEKKKEIKKASKAKKVASLFDDDDVDDLFGTSSAVGPPEIKVDAVKDKPAKETEGKPNKKIKARSFIDDDESGLFGNDQEDLFSATKSVSSSKQKSTAKAKPKEPSSFLNDNDDDFFGFSNKNANSPVAETNRPSSTASKSTVPRESEKISSSKPKPAPAKGMFADGADDTDELFATDTKTKTVTEKSAKVEITEKLEEKVESEKERKEVEVDNSPTHKAKKLPGAVSLFGGIDPFAAKKNLKSADKDEGPVDNEDKEQLFSSRPLSSKPETTESRNSIAKPSADKPQSGNIIDAKGQDNASPAKIKPTIAFNPATLLPGASPPVRNAESPKVSFDEPAAVQALPNANKDRVRGQKKRRPPSRHFVKGAASATNDLTDGGLPDNLQSKDKTLPTTNVISDHSAGDRNLATGNIADDLFAETTSKKKTIKKDDIFPNDDDDDDDRLFSQPFGSGKSREAQKNDSHISKSSDNRPQKEDITAVSPSKPDRSHESNISPAKSVASPDSNISSSKSDVTNVSSHVEKATRIEKEHPADLFAAKSNDDIFTTDSKPPSEASTSKMEKNVKIEDDIFDPSTWKSDVKDSKSGENEDLFQPVKKINDDKKKVDENINEHPPNLNEESNKTKKNKTDTNVFKDDVDDELFTSVKTKDNTKKDTQKKTKKSSNVVTDDDLFGDSGSIFSDIPTKAKEKKKKKTDGKKDIFANNDEDIFATATEKKTKTKRKVEKTSKAKTTKSSADQNTPSIFDDPLNALGGD